MRAEGAWPIESQLLAGIVEEVDALARLTYQINSGKKAPWKPVRIERPRPEGTPARREASPEEVFAMLGVRGGVNGG